MHERSEEWATLERQHAVFGSSGEWLNENPKERRRNGESERVGDAAHLRLCKQPLSIRNLSLRKTSQRLTKPSSSDGSDTEITTSTHQLSRY
eukprot:4437436-Pleurochrysis_carterae.AAC.3